MKKLMLAATALAVVAFTALPAVASASDVPWTSGLPANATFSSASTNTATLYGAANVVCESTEEQPNTITTSGKFETPDTGSVKFTFHNCHDTVFNSACWNAGEESEGTIETTTLPFHLVYLEPKEGGETHERPGVLITPGSETNEMPHFASFECLAGFISVEVGGNGILGTVTEPGIGEESHSFGIKVSATENGQEHTTTHTTGTEYGLTASVNGGETEPAYEDAGEASATFDTAGVEGTTTTETP